MKIQLTEEQKEIVRKSGRYVVRAVPGSGKTITVAYKVMHLLQNWNYKHRGIAILSFTNAAWQEIEKYLKDEGVKLSYPHFLGTLDSFINRYIFRPFINFYISAEFNRQIDSIKMYGQPYNDWNPIGNGYRWGNRECYKCDIRTISYDLNGNLIDFKPNSHFGSCSVVPQHKYCKEVKEQVVLDGFFTQNDANYYALKVIFKSPLIAKALIRRFPVFIIDEAQDTSEIQMAIIDQLVEAGLEEVALIGDPDQAIFEWRDAKPELFLNKMQEWDVLEIQGNWRSSQKICDFYKKISSASEIVAVNEEIKDYFAQPEIWSYSDNDHLKTLINDFISKCESQNIEVSKEKIAVVFRSNKFINELLGTFNDNRFINPWKLPNRTGIRDDRKALLLAKSKLLQEIGNLSQALSFVEKALCGFLLRSNLCEIGKIKQLYNNFGMVKFRILCWRLLLSLPVIDDDITLGDWTDKTNEILNSFDLNKILLKRRHRDKKMTRVIQLDIHVFPKSKLPFYIGTIHSIKGKSFEALMLVVKRRDAKRRFYKNLLENFNIQEEEEIRNIYVAMSRPRKILILTVPEEDKGFWERRFLND